MEESRLWNIEKYKNIEKFRVYDDIKILNTAFLECFLRLYKIFQKEVSNNKINQIFIKNKNLTYIKELTTVITEEKIMINSSEIDSYIDDINKNYEEIKFNIPDMRELSFLDKRNILSKGYWWYKGQNNYKYSRSTSGVGDFKVVAISNLDKYMNQQIGKENVYSKELILFKVFLNLGFIIETEHEKEFEYLNEQYKKFRRYLSSVSYSSKEDKIVIAWKNKKLLKNLEIIQNEDFKVEIPYNPNEIGVEREIISLNKKTYYFSNGDREELNIVENHIESKYYFYNGDMEKRTYIDGILQGDTILKKNEKEIKKLCNIGEIGADSKLKYYLSIDKERINIDEYQENILLDPNIGHWDLKDEDMEELRKIFGKNVYKREPQKDVNREGIVAIDFGTKSTVVVYQNDNGNIIPMRIGGRALNKEADAKDYENPTVIEFRDIINFLKDYNEKIGRPYTKWEDITVSHTALSNLFESNSEDFNSIMTEIKQWTTNKNDEMILVDKKGKRIKLPPYLEKEEDYLDPVEIYAYYIGSYINTMRNGIFLKYILSFPVTYEKVIREKILESFRKGIQKSLPVEIQEDKDLMKEFKVKHGANEPAAFAVCALSELKIEPKEETDKVYYGVFDFGGGTTDFDFGIWKFASKEDQEAGYDYELEHFGAGGEKYLGGENIITELAYSVFYDNAEKLRTENIQYTRPIGYDELPGEEILVSETKEAKMNIKILAEKLRTIWEENEEKNEPIKCILYDADRKINTNIELKVDTEKLKNIIREKIEKGIKNFFIKMNHSFRDEDTKEINIFLAGNSSKHPYVEEIFKRYQEEMKEKIKLNIYSAKIFEEFEGKSNIRPNVKTGVAYGLIYSRDSGNIKVVSRDEKENLRNEINFKYYIGTNKRGKFNSILNPNSVYEKYEFFGVLKTDVFEFYYTTSSEAHTDEMSISEAKLRRINLKNNYILEDRYRIYFKIIGVETLEYVIVKNEDSIEIKDFIEDGTIILN